MVMIRPKGKATQIAEKVMKKRGKKIQKGQDYEHIKLQTPYLQH